MKPIRTFELDMAHMKQGIPLDGAQCPVAQCLEPEYETISIDREETEYSDAKGNWSIKNNSWTLFALVHAIDHPHVPIYAVKQGSKIKDLILGGDKGIHVPITIEEYENTFNAVLDNYPNTHLDAWHCESIFDDDNSLKEVIIVYTQP